MKIKKALITAAGQGTRFLPLTKTIQKEMLPILDKPVIDYVVDDCINAGIEEIIFVIKPSDTQIKHYYSYNDRLYQYLKDMNKLDKYQKIENLHTKAKFSYVIQNPNDPYGTATPLKLAKEYLQNEEAFLVFMGDVVTLHEDGSSEAQQMIDYYISSGAKALASFIPLPESEITKNGIADTFSEGGFKYLKQLIEKPSLEAAPSNLGNTSRYIYTPQVFEILANQQVNPIRHELEITDTISEIAKTQKVAAFESKGEFLDSGFLLGWLKANLRVAAIDQNIKEELKKYMASL